MDTWAEAASSTPMSPGFAEHQHGTRGQVRAKRRKITSSRADLEGSHLTAKVFSCDFTTYPLSRTKANYLMVHSRAISGEPVWPRNLAMALSGHGATAKIGIPLDYYRLTFFFLNYIIFDNLYCFWLCQFLVWTVSGLKFKTSNALVLLSLDLLFCLPPSKNLAEGRRPGLAPSEMSGYSIRKQSHLNSCYMTTTCLLTIICIKSSFHHYSLFGL